MNIITGGQSFEELAELLTLDASYAPALAAQSNMAGKSITGKKFYLTIPDEWVKDEFKGKTVKMPETSGGGITPLVIAAGVAAVFLLSGRK